MLDALNVCPSGTIVMGNLDPVTLFKDATPEDLRVATLDLLAQTSAYPNFIISSGCDVPPHTSHANIAAFYAALIEYNSITLDSL